MLRRSVAVTWCALAASAVAACGGGSRPAAQAPSGSAVTTLRAATAGSEPGYLAMLTREVARRTDGRVRIVDRRAPDTGDDAAGEETLVKAVRDGAYDIALVPTRGVEAAGVSALAAFDAPLLVPGVEAERRVLASPAVALALAAIHAEAGVDGLAILPGPLRRPVGTPAPFRGPDDYRGGKVSFYPGSPTYARTVEALGGTPVLLSAKELARAARDGEILGTESDVVVFRNTGLAAKGPMTANVVLFAKFWAMIAAPKVLDRLSAADRAAVTDAIGAVADRAFATLPDEDAVLNDVCGAGGKVVTASADDIAALRAAVTPVWDAIAADATSAPVFSAVRSAVGNAPMDAADAPACQDGEPSPPSTATAAAAPAIPEGTYRTRVTAADVGKRFPQFSADDRGCTAGVFTLRLHRGAFRYSQHFTDPCGTGGRDDVAHGTYTTTGDHLTLASVEVNPFTQQAMASTCRWAPTADGIDTVVVDGWDGSAGVNGFCGILGPDPAPTLHWRRIGS